MVIVIASSSSHSFPYSHSSPIPFLLLCAIQGHFPTIDPTRLHVLVLAEKNKTTKASSTHRRKRQCIHLKTKRFESTKAQKTRAGGNIEPFSVTLFLFFATSSVHTYLACVMYRVWSGGTQISGSLVIPAVKRANANPSLALGAIYVDLFYEYIRAIIIQTTRLFGIQ